MDYLYRFFDKNGLHLDPDVDETGVYNINIQLDNVSVGLFETQQIHIFEEVYEKTKNNNSLPVVNDSKLYSVLSAIKTSSETKGYAEDKDLYYLFPYNLVLDTVINYLKSYSPIYVTIEYDSLFEKNVYRLTDEAEDLLMYAEYKIEKRILAIQGYESTLVKPRFKTKINNTTPNKFISTLLNTQNEEDNRYCFYFRWKNVSVEALSIFGIIDNDVEITETTSVANKKNVYPSIIQFPNNVLSDINKFNKYIRPNFLCDVADNDYVISNYVFTGKKILVDENGKAIKSNKEPITLNICANSEFEGYYENTLEVFIMNSNNELYKFANIEIAIDIIGEDERLSKLLENFGREIDVNDYYVIRDYDLNDDKLDFIKINEKRKELLIESENIFPYIGSYKSLYNGLKWLGWQDVTIREYFYNIQTSNIGNIDYQYVDIPIDYTLKYNADANDKTRSEYTLKKYTNLILSDTWKKTTRIGLIYPYNTVSDELGPDDLPKTNSVDIDFNAEELLVKLYGLKKFLYKYLLPHNARIINIGLEGIYFTKVQFINWNNILPIIDLVKQPNFSVSVKNPKQIKLNLFDIIRKFAKYNGEHLWVDDFNTLGDFIRANKKLSEFGMLSANVFGGYSDIHSEKICERLGVPNAEMIFNDIISFLKTNFKSYKDFEIWLNESLRKSDCYPCEEMEYKDYDFKGGVFLLEAKEKVVTFADISHIQFWMFTVQNPVQKKCLPLRNLGPDMDYYEYYVNRNEIAECKPCESINKGEHINWNFESFNIHKNTPIEWTISHEDGLYCNHESGAYSNLRYKLFIGPHVGKYNATCIIKDDFNFPNIKKINSAMEVIIEDFDIYTIGRNVIKDVNTWGNTNTFNSISGTFFNTFRNGIEGRTFEQCGDLSFQSLEFFDYLDCEYYLDYINFSKVVDINTTENKLKLRDNKFFEFFEKYSKNWDYIYLQKNNNEWTQSDIPVMNFKKNSFTIPNDFGFSSLQKREIINIYEIFDSYNFNIIGDKIKISMPGDIPINIFRNDSIITLSENRLNWNIYDLKSLDFKVKFVEYNFIEHSVLLTIENINENLSFSKEIFHDPNYEYNYSNWQKLSLKYNISTFRVAKSIGNEIFINGDLSLLRKLSLKNDNELVQFYMQSGQVNKELIKIPLSDVRVDLEVESNRTILTLNNNLCGLTPGFDVVYGEFDYLNAKLHSKFEDINFSISNSNNFSFENLKNQTFESLSYNSAYTTGFVIGGMDNIPAIKTESSKLNIYLTLNGKDYNLDVDDVDMNLFSNIVDKLSIKTAITRAKRSNVINSLKKITHGPVSEFEYNPLPNTNDKIVAISKGNSTHSIYKISSSVFDISDEITFPKIGWYDKQLTEFKNIQNPDYTNHLCRAYIENKHLFDAGSFSNEDILTSSYIRGRNDFGKTFIRKDSFDIDTISPLFFTISNKEYFNTDEWEFEWVVFHQDSNRVLIKSNKDYISYIIVLNGVYDISLKVTNKKTNKSIQRDKKSFFIKK